MIDRMEKAKGDEEVEEATETANATAVKKKNIFKKIFQPWKWKTKKKSKLKTKVAIFERKLSVRVSQRGKRQGLEVVGDINRIDYMGARDCLTDGYVQLFCKCKTTAPHLLGG